MSERRRGIPLADQIGALAPLLGTWLVGCTVLAIAGVQRAAPAEALFLDTNHVAGVAWYAGLLSNLGILAWTVAVCAAVGGAWLSTKVGRRRAALFLGSGAVVSAVLLADDLLQLHAAVLPAIGITKPTTLVVVAIPAPIWMWTNRREIGRSRWVVLAAATACLGVSAFADHFVTAAPPTSAQLFLEDGAKLLGAFTWAEYFLLTTADIARSSMAEAFTRRAGHTSGPDAVAHDAHPDPDTDEGAAVLSAR